MRQYIVDTILYRELNLLIRGEQKTGSQHVRDRKLSNTQTRIFTIISNI